MCRARVARPWFEINLVVIEGTGRQHNASGGYKFLAYLQQHEPRDVSCPRNQTVV
jgi:hypothetical protein